MLDMLLAGDDPELSSLREQMASATISRREYSGAGFFTTFAVDPSAPRVTRRMPLGDVYADVSGLAHPAGFMLFFKDGLVDFLECFIVDASWPEDGHLIRAFYMHPDPSEPRRIIETQRRDLGWALRPAVQQAHPAERQKLD